MWIRIGISLLIVGAIVIALYFLARSFGLTKISQEELQKLIESTGVWGPLVFIVVSFLQVTFLPIPSTLTIVAGCYLFGALGSFLYSYIGIVAGSLFAFFLGKKIGRPFVNWIVGDKDTVEKYLQRMKHKENVVLFFMFLFPFFPDDVLCAIAGILPVRWITFIIMQVVTRATSIGGNLLFLSGEVIPFHGWGIPVLILLGILSVILFIVCYRKSDQLNELFDRFIRRITKKKEKSAEE